MQQRTGLRRTRRVAASPIVAGNQQQQPQPQPQPQQQPAPLSGATCNGYTLVRVVGKGGFGTVYEVMDRQGRRKALKVVPFKEQELQISGFSDDAVMELQVLERAKHPNLTPLEDVFFSCGESDQTPRLYTVTDFANKGDLAGWIKEFYEGPSGSQRLNQLREFGFYLHDVLLGLQYLHDQSIAHMDIKPGNVLLTDNAEAGRTIAKLTDYGLTFWRHQLAFNGGTPGYKAPELFELEEEVEPIEPFQEIDGFKADVWSIGMLILNFLFRGTFRLYWSAENSQDANVPPDAALVLNRLLLDPNTSEFRWQPLDRFVETVFFKLYPPDGHVNRRVAAGMWKSLFELAKECLRVDPNRRPTVGELLVHDYFARVLTVVECWDVGQLTKHQILWYLPQQQQQQQLQKTQAKVSGLWEAIKWQAQAHKVRDVSTVALAMWIGLRFLTVSVAQPSGFEREGLGGTLLLAFACLSLAYKQRIRASLKPLYSQLPARALLTAETQVLRAVNFQIYVDTRWYKQAADLDWLQFVWCTNTLPPV